MRTWSLMATAVTFLGLMAGTPGTAGAGSPSHPVPPAVPAPTALGPGPVPFHRPAVRHGPTLPAVKSLTDAIDQCMEQDMDRIDAPGAAVAVMLGGELMYEQGYGVRHRTDGGDVTPHTVFRIGSVTKMMTAAAVLTLVDSGEVDLADPVRLYVPELEVAGPWPADRMTVWHLLTHTSGFPDTLGWYDMWQADDDGALARWAADQADTRMFAPPGEFWNYSNPGFSLAGLVVERASGLGFRRFVEERVWEPAGMDSTTFDPAAAMADGDYSWGHYTDPIVGRRMISAPDDYNSGEAAPAGMALSTAGDLVRWAELLMNGGDPVLSPAAAAAMQESNVWTHYTPDLHYGYGVFREEYKGLDVRQHGGNVPGWGAWLLWVPDEGFAVATLANTTQSLNEAAYCIVDEVLQPDASGWPPSYPTDPVSWARYVGDYPAVDTLGDELPMVVSFAEGGLKLTFPDIPNPRRPDEPYSSTLTQLYLDTFGFDGDADFEIDSEVTFINFGVTPGGEPSPVRERWLRNRVFVGGRVWSGINDVPGGQ